VLFLDEPTTGVDAVSRKEFWDMLKRLKTQGITIIVSTPYMDEAALCERVILLQAGRVLSTGSPTDIINEFTNTILAVKSSNMFGLLKELKACPLLEDGYSFGEYHHAVLKKQVTQDQLKTYLEDKGYDDVLIHATNPNIEDCFMHLMQN